MLAEKRGECTFRALIRRKLEISQILQLQLLREVGEMLVKAVSRVECEVQAL